MKGALRDTNRTQDRLPRQNPLQCMFVPVLDETTTLHIARLKSVLASAVIFVW